MRETLNCECSAVLAKDVGLVLSVSSGRSNISNLVNSFSSILNGVRHLIMLTPIPKIMRMGLVMRKVYIQLMRVTR